MAWNPLRKLFGNQTEGPKRVSPFRERGKMGTAVVGGRVYETDVNAKMRGDQKYITAAEMLTNMSIVAAGVRHFLDLVAKPAWSFDPADDSPEALEYAEFIKEVISDTRTSWARIVRRFGMYKFYGFSTGEWTAKKRKDGKIGLLDIEARPQHTIKRWAIDESGNVTGVWQRPPMTGEEIWLPRQKLLYLVDDMMTDSPEGLGWLRALAEPMERLKRLQELETTGYERNLAGTPIGRIPYAEIADAVEAGEIEQSEADEMISEMEDFLDLQKKQPTTSLALESMPYVNQTDSGESFSSVFKWGMELLRGDLTGMDHLGESIDRITYEMAMIIGVQGLLVGKQGAGSLALSQDKSTTMYLVVNSTLGDMREAVDRDVIDTIWMLNGFPEEMKPRSRTEDVTPKDVGKITDALRSLASAGATISNRDPVVNNVRDLMGVERMPEELIDLEMEAEEALRGEADDPDAPADPEDEEEEEQIGTAKANAHPLYVERKLLNADDVIAWAKENGFEATVPPDEMHVTVTYSRTPVDPMKMGIAGNKIEVPEGGPRAVQPLGDKGAVVLHFKSPAIEQRHYEMIAAGASHDFPEFQTHVTITYDGGGIDLAGMKPYSGPLIFGPELFSPLDDDWKDKITEKVALARKKIDWNRPDDRPERRLE
jgi:hypothetical protein